MSQFPPVPPFQPPSGSPYGYSIYPNPRPRIVTGLSITAIILGSLGILCNGVTLAIQIALIATGGKNPFVPGAPVFNNPAINSFGAASAAVTLGLSITLLVGGIGGLKLWPFARKLMILWSVVTVIWVTSALAIQIVWVLPATTDFMAQAQARSGKPLAPNVLAGYRIGQVIGAGFVWMVWCVLPIFFLTFWRSERVISAFDSTAQTPPPPPQGTWTP